MTEVIYALWGVDHLELFSTVGIIFPNIIGPLTSLQTFRITVAMSLCVKAIGRVILLETVHVGNCMLSLFKSLKTPDCGILSGLPVRLGDITLLWTKRFVDITLLHASEICGCSSIVLLSHSSCVASLEKLVIVGYSSLWRHVVNEGYFKIPCIWCGNLVGDPQIFLTDMCHLFISSQEKSKFWCFFSLLIMAVDLSYQQY